MEFDELQKIWDAQTSKPLYAIDETALHNRILSKKKQASHITNISELLLIIINLGAGGFVLEVNLEKQRGNMYLYVLAAWMFATSLYLLVSRVRRIKGDRQFDRSMLGDLHHAVSMARYQVRLSQIMRWNILPVGALTLMSLWEGQKPLWTIGMILCFFVLAYFKGIREHRFYKARRRELEVLENKLATKD